MKIELNKKDLISLVMGTTPYYDVMDNPLVKECGEWIGGMADRWSWEKYKLENLDEKELYDLYLICKNSWK